MLVVLNKVQTLVTTNLSHLILCLPIQSAHLRSTSTKYSRASTTYVATGTNGTWTATGIAP